VHGRAHHIGRAHHHIQPPRVRPEKSRPHARTPYALHTLRGFVANKICLRPLTPLTPAAAAMALAPLGSASGFGLGFGHEHLEHAERVVDLLLHLTVVRDACQLDT